MKYHINIMLTAFVVFGVLAAGLMAASQPVDPNQPQLIRQDANAPIDSDSNKPYGSMDPNDDDSNSPGVKNILYRNDANDSNCPDDKGQVKAILYQEPNSLSTGDSNNPDSKNRGIYDSNRPYGEPNRRT